MQRLRKARELELQHDVKIVKRDMHLIRLPVADMQERNRRAAEGVVEEIHDSDEEMEEMNVTNEEKDIEEEMNDSDTAPELIEVS